MSVFELSREDRRIIHWIACGKQTVLCGELARRTDFHANTLWICQDDARRLQRYFYFLAGKVSLTEPVGTLVARLIIEEGVRP